MKCRQAAKYMYSFLLIFEMLCINHLIASERCEGTKLPKGIDFTKQVTVNSQVKKVAYIRRLCSSNTMTFEYGRDYNQTKASQKEQEYNAVLRKNQYESKVPVTVQDKSLNAETLTEQPGSFGLFDVLKETNYK